MRTNWKDEVDAAEDRNNEALKSLKQAIDPEALTEKGATESGTSLLADDENSSTLESLHFEHDDDDEELLSKQELIVN